MRNIWKAIGKYVSSKTVWGGASLATAAVIRDSRPSEAQALEVVGYLLTGVGVKGAVTAAAKEVREAVTAVRDGARVIRDNVDAERK